MLGTTLICTKGLQMLASDFRKLRMRLKKYKVVMLQEKHTEQALQSVVMLEMHLPDIDIPMSLRGKPTLNLHSTDSVKVVEPIQTFVPRIERNISQKTQAGTSILRP